MASVSNLVALGMYNNCNVQFLIDNMVTFWMVHKCMQQVVQIDGQCPTSVRARHV